MTSGLVKRGIETATNRVPGLRQLPVMRLLAAAEIAMLTRDHVQRLDGDERRRLLHLVRVGRGGTHRLTDDETQELHDLVVKLEPRRLAGDAAVRLSPVPLPKRLLYGPRGRPTKR